MRTVQPQRLDLHNLNVDFDAASRGLCGFTHLASGRVCRLPNRHAGACQFGVDHHRDKPPTHRGLRTRRR